MELLSELNYSFIENSSRYCLCDKDEFYTYSQLLENISSIRTYIRKNIPKNQQNIGIVSDSDIYTYSAIFAILFEGKTYVPILSTAPQDRNANVCEEANLTHILTSNPIKQKLPVDIVLTRELPKTVENECPVNTDINRNAYILFTSGTTGKPKGVQVTLGNIIAFIAGMDELGYNIRKEDKVLQMYDLTFDLSVNAYLYSMYSGACIYTIPIGEVKYSYILDLLEEYHLTVLHLVPSIISYLQIYFDEVRIEETRLCTFCGEALTLPITKQWQECIPNAEIVNFYGPTEDTIWCSYYAINNLNQKNVNDVISIGKAMKGGSLIIVDENGKEVGVDERGELCLSGPQLSPGYWNNPEKNAQSFFCYKGKRYYRTGDLCYKDKDGDVQYIGRMDFQAKIQGFRVELSEVEHFVSEVIPKGRICICVAFQNKMGNTEIGLALQNDPFDYQTIIDFLNTKLPPYEIPTKILFFKQFPLNINGKLDRKTITKKFEE